MYPDVKGYGVVREGEKYHPSAFFDPKVTFANSGVVNVDEPGDPVTTVTTQGAEETLPLEDAKFQASQLLQPAVVVTKAEDGVASEVAPVTGINVVVVGEDEVKSEPESEKPADTTVAFE